MMSNKRSVEDSGDGQMKRPRMESGGPSKVLHIRNVDASNSHAELVSLVSQFGSVISICFMSKFNQALIEMDSVDAASAVVSYSQTNPLYIQGKQISVAFSRSQGINNPTQPGQGGTLGNSSSGVGPSNVLLCTILNPLYNITVDVMHAIMSPYGMVNRIVVFNKNGVQVLVEFENSTSASIAKSGLDGKDIYAGSCTLKIDFSKAQKLNVHANNDKTRDYTNASLPAGPSGGSASLAGPYPGGSSAASAGGFGPGGAFAAFPGAGAYPYGAPSPYGMPMSGMPEPAGRSVIIAYGLNDLNPDKIFNLFCLYGNVAKVKILPQGKGSLIQMNDNSGADAAINNLNGAFLFGKQLQLMHSKHAYIADSRSDADPNAPPGSTAQSKDFTSSQLNRASRSAPRHMYRPSTNIYFSNAPKDFTEENFQQLFSSQGILPPAHVKFFALDPNRAGEGAERRVGLLEFVDPTTATEAVVTVNNQRVNGHTLKLAFSQNSITNTRIGGQQMQHDPNQIVL